MLCDCTHAFDFTPEHEANWPSNMHPLNLMHSSLPGAGYDVKFVLLADFHTRPGVSQPVAPPPVVVVPPPVVVLPPVVVPPEPQLFEVTTTFDADLKFDASVE